MENKLKIIILKKTMEVGKFTFNFMLILSFKASCMYVTHSYIILRPHVPLLTNEYAFEILLRDVIRIVPSELASSVTSVFPTSHRTNRVSILSENFSS